MSEVGAGKATTRRPTTRPSTTTITRLAMYFIVEGTALREALRAKKKLEAHATASALHSNGKETLHGNNGGKCPNKRLEAHTGDKAHGVKRGSVKPPSQKRKRKRAG